HSVRVGGAIQLNIEGYSLPQIMEMGNWSNEEMVMRYIRNIEAGKKAMIKLMRNAFDE
ncbi:TPA: recombinase, partial [Escherichia coli]|nr:recombinase [Escherichia coli]